MMQSEMKIFDNTMRSAISAIQNAVNEFVINEMHLLTVKASERCLTHRFAIALNDTFNVSDVDIDVEYNRNGMDEKILYWQANQLKIVSELRKIRKKNNESYTLIVPDIIIHKRGTDENFIAFEIKKKSNICDDEKIFDRMKLSAYTKSETLDLKYKLGVYIEFDDSANSSDTQIEFYANGDLITAEGKDVG